MIETLTGAVTALSQASHEPKNDTAFLDHVDEIKRNVLRPSLEAAQAEINLLSRGLAEIEKKSLSLRQQKKLFKALDK